MNWNSKERRIAPKIDLTFIQKLSASRPNLPGLANYRNQLQFRTLPDMLDADGLLDRIGPVLARRPPWFPNEAFEKENYSKHLSAWATSTNRFHAKNSLPTC